MPAKLRPGHCDICGRDNVKVKGAHGLTMCSTCVGAASYINQNPKAAENMFRHLHGDKYLQAPAGSEPGDAYQEILAGISDLFGGVDGENLVDKVKGLQEELDQGHGDIRDLQEKLAARNDLVANIALECIDFKVHTVDDLPEIVRKLKEDGSGMTFHVDQASFSPAPDPHLVSNIKAAASTLDQAAGKLFENQPRAVWLFEILGMVNYAAQAMGKVKAQLDPGQPVDLGAAADLSIGYAEGPGHD